MAPEVSLILPTQGRRSSLAAALRSALKQEGVALEVLVVDDSTVGPAWRESPSMGALLAEPRVRVVPFHQGRGCAAAKNAGLRAARGEWVCYLDDDNEYLADKVAAQLALARSTGCPVVLCGLAIEAGGRRRLRQVDRAMLRGVDRLLAAVPDTNVIFHRRAGSPWWDEDLQTIDDACFFQAWLAQARIDAVPNVPRALVLYRAHRGPRANVDGTRVHRGLRRLLVRWAPPYGLSARRVLAARIAVAAEKHRPGGWLRLATAAWRLWRVGGWREWRVVANAAGVKLPLVRRWMVT